MRHVYAILVILAITLGTANTAAAAGIQLSVNDSICGQITLTATGLGPNTAYQLVADGGYPDVVKAVTSNASGAASATFQRSEFSSDSSANWGSGWVRTQTGGYLDVNVSGMPPVAHPPAYHFC